MSVFLNIILILQIITALLYLVKITTARQAADRAICFDGFASSLACAIAAVCIVLDETWYYDAVLFYALLGFIGLTAVSKYLAKGRIF
jgi:multicomponent Na+:H+ antiporter subunit F